MLHVQCLIIVIICLSNQENNSRSNIHIFLFNSTQGLCYLWIHGCRHRQNFVTVMSSTHRFCDDFTTYVFWQFISDLHSQFQFAIERLVNQHPIFRNHFVLLFQQFVTVNFRNKLNRIKDCYYNNTIIQNNRVWGLRNK